jgi:epoxyqueuosine reductase
MVPLETRLKQQAQALGFALAGIAPATPADGFDRLCAWLARGYAGEMGYMHRHAEARRHPSSILPEVRSVVMVGMNYGASRERPEGEPGASATGGTSLR